ncbi:MAG: sigma 54-interacting transcriptional regulator, partial [Planctomycetaceae bacterium]|nr:sigma 54-interacting transcriptional regulator [Planctomycetaceae bacterium]
MPKHVSVNRLSRLLQELQTPVYVLDEKQTLVYFNEALVQWANVDADALIGQTCRYHTSASRLHHEIVAASLAAPPEVERGQRTETVLAVDAVQEVRYRRAEFFPLARADGMFAVLVLVDAVDLAPEATGDDGRAALAACRAPLPRAAHSVETVETVQARELHRVLFALRRHQAGRYRMEALIGHTPAMQQARQQAMLAAETTAPVLIVGPPGSGRETLAGTIHFGRDGEQSGGMIPVDCHALPSELIDSTIGAFYRRYAASDRQKRHTLLLNNADLLEPGSAELVVSVIANNPGNMRIIGTSSLAPRDWQNHPTLPFHLATITIHLPPLTERRDDIPLLAQWFLEQHNARVVQEDKKSGRVPSNVAIAQRTGFAADALDLLALYHWPGNMDELLHVVEASHASARGTLVRAADLPVRLRQAADAQAADDVEEQIDLEHFLQSVEVELIQRALRVARGNKAKAARLLGMTRPRLYRRLEQLGLIELPTPEFGVSKQDAARESP